MGRGTGFFSVVLFGSLLAKVRIKFYDVKQCCGSGLRGAVNPDYVSGSCPGSISYLLTKKYFFSLLSTKKENKRIFVSLTFQQPRLFHLVFKSLKKSEDPET
jgi:hypothetical protein